MLEEDGKLPRVLLLQVDNTCKENKNNTVLPYLALLVHFGVFDYVQVNTLLVGHTHCIIDQRFSVIHRKFRTVDGYILDHLADTTRTITFQGKKRGNQDNAERWNKQQIVRQGLDFSWLQEFSYYFKGVRLEIKVAS